MVIGQERKSFYWINVNSCNYLPITKGDTPLFSPKQGLLQTSIVVNMGHTLLPKLGSNFKCGQEEKCSNVIMIDA